jgi:hypothetical protein
MWVGVGFTAEEIGEVVHQQELQPRARRRCGWWSGGVSYDRLGWGRWRSVVSDDGPDRGLIPRDRGHVTIPPTARCTPTRSPRATRP